MKTLLKLWLFVLLSCKGNLTAFTQVIQNRWQMGANIGVIVYQGDLAPSLFGHRKNLKPIIGFNISRVLKPSFRLRTSLVFGQIIGDEGVYTKPAYRQQRNLSFSTPLAEISEMVVWNFLNNKDDLNFKLFSPYVFGGVGVSFLNINRSFNNIRPIYFENEPRAVQRLAQDLQTKPPKTILIIPVGIGVEYIINKYILLCAEINFRYTQTDYLDGFSKVGDPKKDDYYYSGTMGFIYKFKKKNMLDCPVLKY